MHQRRLPWRAHSCSSTGQGCQHVPHTLWGPLYRSESRCRAFAVFGPGGSVGLTRGAVHAQHKRSLLRGPESSRLRLKACHAVMHESGSPG